MQANAKRIDITIEYTKNELSKSPIKSISIKDTGHGVNIYDFEKRILEIGTDVKKGGQGVGRFAALQIGSDIIIETVGFNDNNGTFSKVILPINSNTFENKKLVDLNFPTTDEILKGQHNTYYKVTIQNLHHNQNAKTDRKNTIAKELLEENIRLSLFEQYPYQIFNDTVQFYVNKEKLNKSEFIYDKPKHRLVNFIDNKGKEHPIKFFFYNIKLPGSHAKVFFQIENNGIKSVANTYSYTSDWFSNDMGSWYIYISSPLFDLDLFRNIDMDELGDDGIDKLKGFAKGVITDFFISINKKFESFTHKLKDDYPVYYNPKKITSETHLALFEQFAFITEQKLRLSDKSKKIRDVLFPLMHRAIADGNIMEILDSLMQADKNVTDKFKQLLDVTDMESVVHFNTEVSRKLQFLDFLHELNYGKLSNYVLERSQLHKIVEKELWLFGDAYNGVPNILWSDKKILSIFEDLRRNYLDYNLSKEDDNLVELEGEGLNDITDLFFTNEKPLDDGSKEFMIVELKAPKCKLSAKEISQIKRYAWAVESNAAIPKHKAKYKLLLISADMTGQTKSEVASLAKAYQTPFLLERKVTEDGRSKYT